MALRVAAAATARSVTSLTAHPAVFLRGYATSVDKFSGGPPVQSKRPAYDERDTPHTDKWLEVSVKRSAVRCRGEWPLPARLARAPRPLFPSVLVCMSGFGKGEARNEGRVAPLREETMPNRMDPPPPPLSLTTTNAS